MQFVFYILSKYACNSGAILTQSQAYIKNLFRALRTKLTKYRTSPIFHMPKGDSGFALGEVREAIAYISYSVIL